MKIIAYWERGWFKQEPEQEATTDFRMWDHLCRAYGVELQLVDHWSEAVVPKGAKVYLLEEEGSTPLRRHTIDPDGVYVIGRTHQFLPSELQQCGAAWDGVVRINTPKRIPMFGISAGSILLAAMDEQQWP